MRDWRGSVPPLETTEPDPEDDGLKESAVFVPVYEEDGDPGLLFTKRSDDLPRHAGQVSFPGGRREEGDGTLIDTALRELSEEVGLPSEYADVVGRFGEVRTTTGYRIMPFVGGVPRDYDYVKQESEVAELIFAPAAELAEPSVHERRRRGGHKLHYFHYEGYTIWGATAEILVDFLDAVGLWREGR
jgi:8-oxo-dGTP pyrophosphatase MutT (NUDIX family)